MHHSDTQNRYNSYALLTDLPSMVQKQRRKRRRDNSVITAQPQPQPPGNEADRAPWQGPPGFDSDAEAAEFATNWKEDGATQTHKGDTNQSPTISNSGGSVILSPGAVPSTPLLVPLTRSRPKAQGRRLPTRGSISFASQVRTATSGLQHPLGATSDATPSFSPILPAYYMPQGSDALLRLVAPVAGIAQTTTRMLLLTVNTFCLPCSAVGRSGTGFGAAHGGRGHSHGRSHRPARPAAQGIQEAQAAQEAEVTHGAKPK